MNSRFLGRVHFASALEEQERIWQEVSAGAPGCILGFEAEKTITLGVRGQEAGDIVPGREVVVRSGFQIHLLDRGGQATIHNPGQLVIFPICDVRAIGVRRWIEVLSEVTVATLKDFGVKAHWDKACPGVYTENGKIMSCGVRIRRGVSTHGLALNVCNELSDFAVIRACGVAGARVDRMGDSKDVASVFERWVLNYFAFFMPSLIMPGSSAK